MTAHNETAALDHLSELLDELGSIDDSPTQATPSALHLAQTECAIRSHEPFEVIPLEDAPARRSLRADLVVEGLHAARSAVAVIRKTFNDGTADFDDAVKALPVVHRLIEHVEKLEAAKNKLPDLPVLDVRITPGGGMTIRQVTSPEGRRMLDDLNNED